MSLMSSLYSKKQIEVSPGIFLHNEDCMQLMQRYPDKYFDLAIVDPPYGYGDANTKILNFRQDEQHSDWNVAPDESYFKELIRVSKNQIVWGGNYFPYLWQVSGRCFVYWHKGNPVKNFADGELAWTSFQKNARQFDYRYYGNHEGATTHKGEKFHPTQKPIELYKWLLREFSEPGQKILDTHLGGGAIVLACYDLGFELTGSEISENYYNNILRRFDIHVKNTVNQNDIQQFFS